MGKYLFVYHGGEAPVSPEEGEKVMAAWGAWLGGLGAAAIDPGAPAGPSTTVHPDGSAVQDGGSNPASGYSIIEAASMEDAVEKAQGCPIREAGGSIEICEALPM